MQNAVDNLIEHESDDLESGHALLYGQYEIERHLIDGGFGMTYLARDSLDRRVVIKECFPSAVCRRVNGEVRPRKPGYQEQYQNVIRSFLREALRMAKFDHPNIVKVHQVFQENNTAYIAMDYIDGMDLLTMLDMDPGRLSDQLIEKLLRETLHALDYVHDLGMLHRDISPDNLLLDAKDKLTLIDFGAAREEAARQTRALSTVMSVKDGYSPHEFYYSDGTQRPSSDIYSVGATFYHLVTGFAPPDCQKRVAALSSDKPDPFKPLSQGNWALGESILASIDRALSIPQEDRYQSARDWIDALDGVHIIPDAEIAPVTSWEEPSIPPITAPDQPIVQPNTAQEEEPMVELGPELEAKISSLVHSTNTEVEPINPLEVRAKAAEAEPKEETPNTLVDIFGQPIEDVEKWLKEQDKQSSKKPVSAPAEKKPKREKRESKHSQEKQQSSSGFGLLRVFSKLGSKKNRSVIVAQN